MPAIQAPATILVTGGTGFIGAWVVSDLLDRGFSVRAALRTKEGGEFLRSTFPKYQDKLTYVVVPDITKEDAYDEAVKGVDGVEHVASPVVFSEGDPQAVIGPAVAGTVGILKSAHKFGAGKVKRVVITSSVGAIIISPEGLKEPRIFTEADWNDGAVERVKELDAKAHPGDKYAASKVLAERAAWDFVKQNKTSFDLVTVLPSFTTGPFIHQITSKEKLGTSNVMIFDALQPGKTSEELQSPLAVGNFVDVRDIAELHALALVTEHASGERIIGSFGSITPQQVYDVLNEAGIPNVPKGEPGKYREQLVVYSHDNVSKLFPSFKHRDLKATTVDAVNQFREKGWLA